MRMTWTARTSVDTPQQAFAGARANAKRRNIGWYLSYGQWWVLWAPHWTRKQTERMVLGRYADSGPYAVGNCRVITHSQNNSERHERIRMMG